MRYTFKKGFIFYEWKNLRKDTTPDIMGRRTTNLLVSLLCFLIIVLIGLGVFMTWLTKEQTIAFKNRLERLQTRDFYSEEDGFVSENEALSSTEDTYGESEHRFIFVGDSRTVGMEEAVHAKSSSDACAFIGKVGEGHYWLVNDGKYQLDAVLDDEPDATVIFNLGVNDLKEIDRYLETYEKLFADYPEADFHIMSVNPVGDHCEGIDNEEILAFNTKMKEHFPEQYLDCYNYLLNDGFETVDELHYNYETYRKIHLFVIQTLQGA